VGQAFASVGSADPRLTIAGSTEFRLGRQLRGYTREDPPPSRTKPIPISVLHHVLSITMQDDIPGQAVADMIAIAFFFLLRPGEYTAPTADNTPFKLNDVQFWVGMRRVTGLLSTENDRQSATFVTLEFTTQKNGVCGEVIGLGRSGNPFLCVVVSIANRVRHLLLHNAPGHTPLCTYFIEGRRVRFVTPSDITISLRFSVSALGPGIGFLPADVSARSLRAGGAMALLCAHVDPDTIRLIGRWRSDIMLRYLTVQAQPIMHNFARLMVQGGQYNILPNQGVPNFEVPNPQDLDFD
jgi:hypothetical protein